MKKRHLKDLFERQPWSLVTFKALGSEYHRKSKQKPENILKLL